LKFGPVATADGTGAILAHAIRLPERMLKKGQILVAGDVAAIQAAGMSEIIAARLEPGDVHEDEAARRLALALAGENLTLEKPFTGRCNLIAGGNGLLVADATVVDAVNAVHESITVATVAPLRRVTGGEMVATVKIIPFAVPEAALRQAIAMATTPLRLARFRPLRVGVVSTLLPGLRPSTVTKTLRILEERLGPAGATIPTETRVAHATGAIATAIRELEPVSDLVIIFGASAITDRRDVIPTGIEKAGGRIIHLGMPVDPGNLLLIGALEGSAGTKPVIGAPGCARSPKENGFDFVLERLLAGLSVTSADIRGMGVGGLLTEIGTRPQPRAGDV
jgi:molybdenum cofactor cytidylyltransferase